MHFSPQVYRKALGLVRQDKGVVPDARHRGVFHVKGSDSYRVQILSSTMATCSCANGKAKGGEPSCYHVLAVRLFMEGASLDE